jgi:hypothetical protein
LGNDRDNFEICEPLDFLTTVKQHPVLGQFDIAIPQKMGLVFPENSLP